MLQKKSLFIKGVIAFAALSFVGSASAAPAIYEPFTYPAGDTQLDGNTGGTGLTGAWAAGGDATEAGNLTYGTLETSGSATVANGWNEGSPYVGVGGSTLNGLLDDGGELWMSFLYQTPSSGSIRFATGLGDAQITGNGGLDPSVTGAQAIGFSIPFFRQSAYPTMWTSNDFPSGDNIQGAPNGLANNAGLSIDRDGATHMFVLHAEWNADATLTDTLTLYAPGTDLALGSSIVSVDGVLSQDSFDTLFFTGDQAVGNLDEIRVGATYDDVSPVSPVPEPSSFALLAGCFGLAWMMIRRRA